MYFDIPSGAFFQMGSLSDCVSPVYQKNMTGCRITLHARRVACIWLLVPAEAADLPVGALFRLNGRLFQKVSAVAYQGLVVSSHRTLFISEPSCTEVTLLKISGDFTQETRVPSCCCASDNG